MLVNDVLGFKLVRGHAVTPPIKPAIKRGEGQGRGALGRASVKAQTPALCGSHRRRRSDPRHFSWAPCRIRAGSNVFGPVGRRPRHNR